MKKPKNPFVISGYAGKQYFCDREEETKSLISYITNGQSITLTAIRRMGKTGLLKHVLSQLPKAYTGIYIDILPTENLDDFLNTFSSSILTALPPKSGFGKDFLKFVQSLRPVISFDALSGSPMVTIDSRPGEAEMHIEAIFRQLENHSSSIVVAIDEFQQILEYPEKQTDAWLRSIIQSLNNVHFIFSGSRQHLMDELFSSPARPFYRSTAFMNIGKIHALSYSPFIMKHFRKGGKKIKKEMVLEMLDWADGHTYYVQLLCNRVYASSEDVIDQDGWKLQAQKILDEQQMIFFKYRELLSKQQWKLLKAMAREGRTFTPTSKDFIAKYLLGGSATVLRSLHALLDKEMIYSSYTDDGKKFYSVYDVLFRRWMQNRSI